MKVPMSTFIREPIGTFQSAGGPRVARRRGVTGGGLAGAGGGWGDGGGRLSAGPAQPSRRRSRFPSCRWMRHPELFHRGGPAPGIVDFSARTSRPGDLEAGRRPRGFDSAELAQAVHDRHHGAAAGQARGTVNTVAGRGPAPTGRSISRHRPPRPGARRTRRSRSAPWPARPSRPVALLADAALARGARGGAAGSSGRVDQARQVRGRRGRGAERPGERRHHRRHPRSASWTCGGARHPEAAQTCSTSTSGPRLEIGPGPLRRDVRPTTGWSLTDGRDRPPGRRSTT